MHSRYVCNSLRISFYDTSHDIRYNYVLSPNTDLFLAPTDYRHRIDSESKFSQGCRDALYPTRKLPLKICSLCKGLLRCVISGSSLTLLPLPSHKCCVSGHLKIYNTVVASKVIVFVRSFVKIRHLV